MSKNILSPGTEVTYTNDKGEPSKGVIFAVSYTEIAGRKVRTSYQIDTGKDERVEKIKHDLRADEITKRSAALVDKGMSYEEALKKVISQKDLPKSKVVVDTIRHPELVTVPADYVKVV